MEKDEQSGGDEIGEDTDQGADAEADNRLLYLLLLGRHLDPAAADLEVVVLRQRIDEQGEETGLEDERYSKEQITGKTGWNTVGEAEIIDAPYRGTDHGERAQVTGGGCYGRSEDAKEYEDADRAQERRSQVSKSAVSVHLQLPRP